jgi:hypothetical protein
MDKLKVLVISQDDKFAIPKNLEKLVESDFIDVLGCILIDAKSTLNNKRKYFAKGFGLKQSFKMGLKIFQFDVFNFIYKLTRSELVSRFKTIKNICSNSGILCKTVCDINGEHIINEISSLKPDIIVSFSAPTVFKKEILSMPRFGCINLHCSKLPNYSGVMPSFWVLLNDEKETGCSVHIMDDYIDNGQLLAQATVPIIDDETMFSLIKKTKEVGGVLMLSILEKIYLENEMPKPLGIDESSRQYYSWPKDRDFLSFRHKGKALI